MSRSNRVAAIVFLALGGLGLLAASALGGTTARVSVASDGAQANEQSSVPSVSANGRFVAFESEASNLVAGDTNGASDVFARDREMGQTTRVSVASDGAQANRESQAPSISADGRFVAFQSSASNLVAGDTNSAVDVFVHDRQTGQTTRVSVASDGAQGNGSSQYPSISADGRFVAFSSWASNLVADDTNGEWDVFVHDRQTGQTTRVSVASGGAQANQGCLGASISANGRFVAFYSSASNLVPGDTNGAADVFVRDRQTGQTTRVSVASGGAQASDSSEDPWLSADGRFVAFQSCASNLVAGDTNGTWDVFVHDRQTRRTTRVSVASDGAQASDFSGGPSLSADGRFVAFYSLATGLVADDTNGTWDVFIHDRQTGQTTRQSVASDGAQANDFSRNPSLSADGRFVAFVSGATNLVAGDTNGAWDIFLRNLSSLPDLEGCVCTAPETAFWGQAINLACQIRNGGDAAAGAFRVEWYLSQDAVGSTKDDILLAQANGTGTFRSHAGIGAGAKGPTFTVSLVLPPDLPSGWSGTGFYIIMRTDSAGAVAESNEDNNFGQVGDNLDRAPIGIHTAVPAVTYPTLPDEVWLPGKSYTITWTDFVASTVKIDLYKGGTLNKTIVASTPNKGSFKWTVPGTQPLGADYTVKVSSTTPAASALSGSELTIANPKVIHPTLAGVAWLGWKSYTIIWSGFPDASVNVDLYRGGDFSRNIATTTPNTGSLPWVVPADVAIDTDYTVEVSSPTNPNLADASDQEFTIAQPTVTYPTKATEVLLGGDTKTILWTGFTGAAVKVDLYKGAALSKTLAPAAVNPGSLPWLVPTTQPPGSDYTVKVTSTENSAVFDSSDKPFTIAAPLVKYPTATGVLWLGGKSYTITWSGFPDTTVKVDLLKGGAWNHTIAAAAPNKGALPWAVPADQTAGLDYTVQVSSTTGSGLSDASDNNFAIAAPKVTYPTAAGVAWLAGEKKTMTWSGFPGANVKVELYKGTTLTTTLTPSTANTGSLEWTVPGGQVGTDYSVKVSSLEGPTLSDSSDAKFTIASPQVIHPSAPGIVFQAGKSATIRWSGFAGTAVKIDLYKNGSWLQTLVGSAPNSGSYTQVVPKGAEAASDYTIKITSTANQAVTDSSDNAFSVIAP